ncbi:short-subunit dehydrogenase [Panacagrimonas perspica]|uniref:Short-subunit dehydrogenase n=1 Tax=Panacagrimonas perspica TaxID=381431 RepID=A0A4V3F5E5_9GAMM|nr:short-subunit dehydrogenase [Panacagrimonas perspica]THD05030.1 short-chain dehydrogenase [Panacagrimonas perspica]
MRKVLIVGATSAIAESVAREFARREDRLFLVGRRPQALAAIADDLKLRGAPMVQFRVQDANDISAHAELIESASVAMGGLDTVLIAHGTLPDQAACAASVERTLAEYQTNALSQISLCTLIANRFESQGNGTLAVISSVAGDRGRQSNYVYGSAKAAVTAFTSGLRQRLHGKGVHVITIKPGFVDTPMTAAFDKRGPLWASADSVAKTIVRGMIAGKPVIYAPWFWWGIMQIIRNIPERIFRGLKL